MNGQWTVEYLETGGPGPHQFAGWYATEQTSSVPSGHGMLCTFAGPFDSEDEAKAWVLAEKGIDPIEKIDGIRELGRRMAMEREQRFWNAFLEIKT